MVFQCRHLVLAVGMLYSGYLLAVAESGQSPMYLVWSLEWTIMASLLFSWMKRRAARKGN